MEAFISYIIEFLIGRKNRMICNQVGYTADPTVFHKYRLVIIPSSFFKNEVYGTDASMPTLPLQEIEGAPLLFGSPTLEWFDETLVVYADVIASSYFLLSRYEEIRKRNVRDKYGRFPGKESLPAKAGFIHRPIVDEYGKLLRKWLRETGAEIKEPEEKIHKIWLTHDIDAPFYCRTFRNLLRETLKGRFNNAWQIYKRDLESDPYYTFPWLIQQNKMLETVLGEERCKTLFFMKAGGKTKWDKPRYKLQSKDIQELIKLIQGNKIRIGLHSSYEAGKKPKLIAQEKEALEHSCHKRIKLNRHHYLSSCEPEDLDWLEKAVILKDFTMGYADVAGFRLGTCRPVKWINPINRRLSNLTLYPLTIMECSLSEPSYMNLSFEEALNYCRELIHQVEKHNGELVLLWHNDTITNTVPAGLSVDWQRTLYTNLIEELKVK